MKKSNQVTVELKRLDWYKNAKVSYIFTAEKIKVINNVKFNSIEIPLYNPNYEELIKDIKTVFTDGIILQKGTNCLIFDKDKVSVQVI